MGYINFDIGNKVLYNNNVVLIAKILDSETIMVRDVLLGTIHTIKIHEIQDVNQTQRNETLFANDSQMSMFYFRSGELVSLEKMNEL